MKRFACLLLSVITLLSMTACGKPKENTTNTLSPASLTPREQMLAGSQDIFIYDFETDSAYKTVTVSIEVYKNGARGDDVANFKCALPQNADKKGGNNHGSLAIILGSDDRFTASVCNADGSVISAAASDTVQPIADATFRKVQPQLLARTPIGAEGQTLAYLAYGEAEKTQGTFEESVFLSPAEHKEKAAAFNRIFLLKCRFS